LLPIRQEDGAITVAIADPLNLYAIDELRLLLGQDVHVVIASSQDISDAIKRFYGVGADTVERLVRSGDAPIEISDEAQEIDLEAMAEDASIVRFVNQIILEAFHSGATDIHIEPFEDDLRIRYRIDGILHEANTPPALKRFQSPIVSRIKIMAG